MTEGAKDATPPSSTVSSGLERARKLYPGRVVTHQKIGVWDYYQEKNPDSGRLLLLSSITERCSQMVKCTPYLVRMIKDIVAIPGCTIRLGAFVVCELSTNVVPAISLWYQSQLIDLLDIALQDGTVDTKLLARVCIGRVACSIANMALRGLRARIRQSLGGRIRRFLALQTFRAYARLDLPTFSQRSVQAQLGSSGGSSMGRNAVWSTISVLTGTAGTFTQLGAQAYVLWNALNRHTEERILALLTLASETIPIFGRTNTIGSLHACAITTTDQDYLKMQGWNEAVRLETHRKELVAGNLVEHATSEYASAAHRVGDNDEDWMQTQRNDRMFRTRAYIQELFVHLPQIAFTVRAMKHPTTLPASLATLNLVQSAAKTFAWSALHLMQQGSNISFQFEAIRNMYEVRNIPNLIPDGTVSFPAHGECLDSGVAIEFRNVSFKYPETEKFALHNISFSLSPGQLCVIVGTNGAGKSTILKLLVRLYDPDEGQIYFGGHDIRTLRLADLRQAVSVLFQDYTHFPLSIRDNIALGDPTGAGDDEHVREAARLGGADSFIEALPEQYDTVLQRRRIDHVIGPHPGSKTVLGNVFDTAAVREAASLRAPVKSELSGGQMQRLAVARTFMRSVVRKDAHVGVLLLDEPSASLDPAAEHDLFDRLRALRSGKTMIFSSHRFGNLTRHADLIIYMDDTGIVESGAHDELLSANGEYARLWNLQAQAFM